MHTYKGSNGTTFNYNSDYSGGINIVAKIGDEEITVPFEDLKEFVALYVRDELMTFAENAKADQILFHAVTRIRD